MKRKKMKRKKKMKRYKIQYLSININLINFIKKKFFLFILLNKN